MNKYEFFLLFFFSIFVFVFDKQPFVEHLYVVVVVFYVISRYVKLVMNCKQNKKIFFVKYDVKYFPFYSFSAKMTVISTDFSRCEIEL